jgi:hypothetical protein
MNNFTLFELQAILKFIEHAKHNHKLDDMVYDASAYLWDVKGEIQRAIDTEDYKPSLELKND